MDDPIKKSAPPLPSQEEVNTRFSELRRKDREEAARLAAQRASALPTVTSKQEARAKFDGEWPEPVNVFAELSAPPYQLDDLPPEIGSYPALYAEATGIDPSLTLTAAVTAAAAAISDKVQMCVNSSTDWFTQPRLWTLAIGPPGAAKSPMQGKMLSPLWELHQEFDEQWQTAKQRHEREMKEHKKRPDDVPEPEPLPPRPRIVVADTTIEAMSEVLRSNPRGVLLANDEFTGLLGQLDRYRSGGVSGDRGDWLRLFDGGPHQIERIQRGSLYVPNWGASILSATTPAALRKLLPHLPEDGLIQRFIIALAQRQRMVSAPGDSSKLKAARDAYRETMRRLYAITPRARNGVCQWSFKAAERFEQWRAEIIKLQEAFGSLDTALEAHIAKHPILLPRIALVYHCAQIVSQAAECARDPAAFPITVATLERAIRFLKRAERHALGFYLGRPGGSPAFELARTIARFIISRAATDNTKGIERRDILQRVKAFRDADEQDQGAALRLLIDLGWLREAEGGYQKAQPTRFTVNPLLPDRFREFADRERERRALVRERISEAAEQRRFDAAG